MHLHIIYKSSQSMMISSINNSNNNLAKLNKKIDDIIKTLSNLSNKTRCLKKKLIYLKINMIYNKKKISTSQTSN